MLASARELDSADTAQSLSNLAGILRLLNRQDEAERLQRQALDMRERALPAVHPHIGESLNSLALILAARAEAARPSRSIAVH